MIPFEFTILGPPVSSQTRNRQRLAQWRADVKHAATLRLSSVSTPVTVPVQLTITYYYEGDTPDVDNIIKPIQDALNNLVYVDDSQVHESKSRKRSLVGSYQIKGASTVLLSGFSVGKEFLHVRVEALAHSGVLDT